MSNSRDESKYKLYTAESFLAEPDEEITYLVDPLIPSKGIVHVHGRWGTWKTALAVEESIAISQGKPFLGMNTPRSGSRVLLIENDMPAMIFKNRFVRQRATEMNENFRFMLPGIFNVFDESFPRSELGRMFKKIQEDWNPQLVIIDTLRKSHLGDEKIGETSLRVYGYFQLQFPNATLQFCNHNRKTGDDKPANENFSGHMGFANDVQSQIGLSKNKGNVTLSWEKSQYHDYESWPEKSLRLIDNGSRVVLQDQYVREIVQRAPREASKQELDDMVAKALDLGPEAARKLRSKI